MMYRTVHDSWHQRIAEPQYCAVHAEYQACSMNILACCPAGVLLTL